MAAVFFCFGRNAAKIAVVKIVAQEDPIVFKSETYRVLICRFARKALESPLFSRVPQP